jgi:BolA protein
MRVEDEMKARLQARFAKSEIEIEIENQSHQHAGHAGDDGTGESHFRLRLRAAELGPMSRIERHRAVQKALGDLNQRIHAIAMDLG